MCIPHVYRQVTTKHLERILLKLYCKRIPYNSTNNSLVRHTRHLPRSNPLAKAKPSLPVKVLQKVRPPCRDPGLQEEPLVRRARRERYQTHTPAPHGLRGQSSNRMGARPSFLLNRPGHHDALGRPISHTAGCVAVRGLVVERIFMIGSARSTPGWHEREAGQCGQWRLLEIIRDGYMVNPGANISRSSAFP